MPRPRAGWELHPRVERRLERRGLDPVSGYSEATQHHFLDGIASWRLTAWAFRDDKWWNGLVIIGLILLGVVAAVGLAMNGAPH